MTPLTAIVLGAALSGCSDKTGDSGTLDVDVVLTDDNNFSYVGDIDVPSTVTVSGADVEVCWDQVDQDIQCHDMDPIAEIDNIGLVRFPHFTQAEVEVGLSENTLLQSDISGYVEWNTDHSSSCVNLGDLSFFGTGIDITKEYTEDGGTYMLLLAEGYEPGVGARMITFLEPSTESDNTRVDVSSGCGLLDFEADIESLTPVEMAADGPYVVDWSGITRDGLGADITLENIDGISIAFYEGLEPADLESQFLDLELIATDLYELSLEGGSQADLADMDGFSGLSGDGTWVLALWCSRCYNPAPVFLTIVEPA